MARKRHDKMVRRYRPQAEAQAFLQYNPERRGLVELLAEAKANLEADMKAAHSTRRGLTAALQAVRPQVERAYDDAGQRMQNAFGQYGGNGGAAPAQGSIAEQLARVGPEAGAIVAAALGEQKAALGRTSEAGAASLADLDEQRVRARSGEAGAVRQARQQYRSDSGKVLEQLVGLDREQGVYTANALDQLVDKARGRAVTRRGQTLSHKDRAASRGQSERNSLRSAGIDPNTGKPIPGGKLDPKAKAKKFQSQSQHGSAADSIGEALDAAKRLRGAGLSDRQKLAAVFKDKAASKEFGVPYLGGHPLFMQAALDLALDGTISFDAVGKLRRRGFRVRDLGFKFNRHPVKSKTGSGLIGTVTDKALG